MKPHLLASLALVLVAGPGCVTTPRYRGPTRTYHTPGDWRESGGEKRSDGEWAQDRTRDDRFGQHYSVKRYRWRHPAGEESEKPVIQALPKASRTPTPVIPLTPGPQRIEARYRGETPWVGPEYTQVWGMLGPRYSTGGDAGRKDLLRDMSFVWGVDAGVNLPAVSSGATAPYATYRHNRVKVDGASMGWDIHQVGAGLQYKIVYEDQVFFHALGEAAYTFWEGFGDARLRPWEDDFVDLPIFSRARGDRSQPDDLNGVTLGAGIGVDFFSGPNLGFGLQGIYRYYFGTVSFDAAWLDLGFTMTVRF